jgi:hypothetical protein
MLHTAYEGFSSSMRSANALENISGFVGLKFVNIPGCNCRTDTGVNLCLTTTA